MDGRGTKKMKTVQEAFQDVSDSQQQSNDLSSSYSDSQQQNTNFTIIEHDDHHHGHRTHHHGQNEGNSNNTNLQFEELSDGEEVMEDPQEFVHKAPHQQQFRNQSALVRNPNSFLVEEQVEQEDSEGEDESGNRYIRTTKTVVNDAKSGQPQTQTKTTTKKILSNDGQVISTSTSSKTVNVGSGEIPVTVRSRTVTSNGNGGTSTSTTTFSSSSTGGFAPQFQNPFTSQPQMPPTMFHDPFFSNPFSNDPFFSDPFGMQNNMMNMQNNMRQQHLQAMQNMQNMHMGMQQQMFNPFPQQGMIFGANQQLMHPNNFPNNQQQNYQQPPQQQQYPPNQSRRY